MKKLLFLSIIIISFSCEEQAIVIPDFEIPATDRVILVEELTGVDCPNCPSGSAKLQSLIEQFQGKIIGVGIHGDFLTDPVEGSIYDFRNQFAIDLEDSFAPFLGKPAAVINRRQFDDQSFLSIIDPNIWISYIEREFDEEHQMELSLVSSYNPDTRSFEATVTAGALGDINENLFISFLLTESHIIDAQKDVSEIIPAYEHNHVLRTMLTNFNGDQLSSGMANGEIITKNYSFTLPPEDGTWIAENIDLIAHVRTNDRVLQAVEAHLVE